MKYLFIVLIILNYSSCKKTQEISFSSYSSGIKIILTPITFDCAKIGPQIELKSIDPTSAVQFNPAGYKIVGRIFPEEEFVSIIYGIPADDFIPVLYTYQNSGTPIDTLTLFLGGCQSDISGGGHSLATIYQNKIIHLFDTTYTRQVDEHERIISKVDTVDVREAKYKLEGNGHITLLSDTVYFVGTKIRK